MATSSSSNLLSNQTFRSSWIEGNTIQFSFLNRNFVNERKLIWYERCILKKKNKRQTKSTSTTPKKHYSTFLVLKKNNNTENPPHPFVGLILVIYFFCKHESVIVICCNITASPYFSSFWGRCSEAKAEILHDLTMTFLDIAIILRPKQSA